ncbi:MAG: hypothetical protein CM15mP98_10390 [Paracoccaceae bacterium]|nr:MAG: hypothetical protein CM15mP98_10390 [Paracoccaceae bacterium]
MKHRVGSKGKAQGYIKGGFVQPQPLRREAHDLAFSDLFEPNDIQLNSIFLYGIFFFAMLVASLGLRFFA